MYIEKEYGVTSPQRSGTPQLSIVKHIILKRIAAASLLICALLSITCEVISATETVSGYSVAAATSAILFGGDFIAANGYAESIPYKAVPSPHGGAIKKLYSALFDITDKKDDGDTEDSDGKPSDSELLSLLYSNVRQDIGSGEHPILAADLSSKAEYGLTCSNETGYEIDLPSYLAADYILPPYEQLYEPYISEEFAPVVLIIHTHGTEAYADSNNGSADKYSESDNSRSSDISKNVVAVGDIMAKTMTDAGISVLHCTEMFDETSYSAAYSRAAAAIREYTAIYPSISYVFDVHRDSVIGENMQKYRPVTVYNGESIAQFMCVVGTDYKGAPHGNWHDNLTLACKLQAGLWNKSPMLTRRLSIRSASFNQQYTSGSLLLEIGSCGNTLDEALRCGVTVASVLSELIQNGGD